MCIFQSILWAGLQKLPGLMSLQLNNLSKLIGYCAFV